jgi:CheY-like chemotaxis protein
MSKAEVACIIDDDQVYVFAMKKMIIGNEFCKEVITFKNGEEALNFLHSKMKDPNGLPEIIMVDINMPVMDGWEFLDEFIKLMPSLPGKITIYMISSSIRQVDIERAKMYSEVQDYIVKPLLIDNLKKILGERVQA